MAIKRCDWAKSELEENYHDTTWGRPVHDDSQLFYMLILEGFQAGLSWVTILKKWDNFFLAFDQFDIDTIKKYDDKKIESLMQDSGIIRNRKKLKEQLLMQTALSRFRKNSVHSIPIFGNS